MIDFPKVPRDARKNVVMALMVAFVCAMILLPLFTRLTFMQIMIVALILMTATGWLSFLLLRQCSMENYKKLYLAELDKNRLTESLKQSESQFKSLFDSMEEGVAIHELLLDVNGKPSDYRIVEVNASYEKHTGVSYADACGLKASELYGTGTPPYLKEFSTAAISGKSSTFETYFAPMNRHFLISVCRLGPNRFATVFENITDRKNAESEQKSNIELLSLLNAKNSMVDLVKALSHFLKTWSGCDAVGIRLKKGNDYPYYETRGFSEEFIVHESSLCSMGDDGKLLLDGEGKPEIECMCGNVICGRFDASKPFFTKRGSFWTNSTTEMIRSISGDNSLGKLRNRCNSAGYESVALVQLKFADTPIGLIQVNDKSKNRFTPARIAQLEQFADNIAMALEQRSNQADLVLEKERLVVTLRSIGDGVVTTDTQGKITLMNSVAEKLTGYTTAEAYGRPLGDIFNIVNNVTRKRCENKIDKVLSSGEICSIPDHTLLIAKDGSEREITDSIAAIRNREGAIFGVVLVFRDITGLRKAEHIQRKNEKLESLGALAAGIAHDFNNLLSGLFGYLDLARESADEKSETATYIDKAFSVFGKTRDLTAQLLTFAKGGAPALRPRYLPPLIRGMTFAALKGSLVTCEFRIDEQLWPCEVDEHQLMQVIDSIVINARDAMPRGGRVVVSAENCRPDSDAIPALAPGRHICICICDEGTGIAPAHLPYIFDPFFTTKQKGSGLGLAVAHSIIKRHNGVINVTSELGKGTVCSIYLPALEVPNSEQVPAGDEDNTAMSLRDNPVSI